MTMIVLCLSSLLLVIRVCQSVEVDYFDFGAFMVQTQKPTGEYVFDYNGNEMFHVDLDSKQVVWTLPGLGEKTSYDVQGALQNMNIGKHNLGVLMKRANNTPATIVQAQAAAEEETSTAVRVPVDARQTHSTRRLPVQ